MLSLQKVAQIVAYLVDFRAARLFQSHNGIGQGDSFSQGMGLQPDPSVDAHSDLVRQFPGKGCENRTVFPQQHPAQIQSTLEEESLGEDTQFATFAHGVDADQFRFYVRTGIKDPGIDQISGIQIRAILFGGRLEGKIRNGGRVRCSDIAVEQDPKEHVDNVVEHQQEKQKLQKGHLDGFGWRWWAGDTFVLCRNVRH